METKEDDRFKTQGVAESSMDVASLNNLVRSGKQLIIAHLNVFQTNRFPDRIRTAKNFDESVGISKFFAEQRGRSMKG